MYAGTTVKSTKITFSAWRYATTLNVPETCNRWPGRDLPGLCGAMGKPGTLRGVLRLAKIDVADFLPEWLSKGMVHRFQIVIENAGKNYSAHSHDLLGCVATGKTREETKRADERSH